MLWLVLVVLAGGVVAGKWLTRKSDVGVVLTTICSLVLYVILLALPISYYKEIGNIQSYYAIKATIETAREQNLTHIERAALTQRIAEVNSWLARKQFWNQTIFDPFIPDDVMKLAPLK